MIEKESEEWQELRRSSACLEWAHLNVSVKQSLEVWNECFLQDRFGVALIWILMSTLGTLFPKLDIIEVL